MAKPRSSKRTSDERRELARRAREKTDFKSIYSKAEEKMNSVFNSLSLKDSENILLLLNKSLVQAQKF